MWIPACLPGSSVQEKVIAWRRGKEVPIYKITGVLEEENQLKKKNRKSAKNYSLKNCSEIKKI